MPKDNIDTNLRKLAHDLRNPVHSAKLNLEAAEMLAGKLEGAGAERLRKHLELVRSELEKLSTLVTTAAEQLRQK